MKVKKFRNYTKEKFDESAATKSHNGLVPRRIIIY